MNHGFLTSSFMLMLLDLVYIITHSLKVPLCEHCAYLSEVVFKV